MKTIATKFELNNIHTIKGGIIQVDEFEDCIIQVDEFEDCEYKEGTDSANYKKETTPTLP